MEHDLLSIIIIEKIECILTQTQLIERILCLLWQEEIEKPIM
jgi:hypothetical protein